jgi:phosphatidylinositol alpha-1,6-mannosyltransferase
VKVLVVTNDFPPKVGGINYYVAEIVRRFPAGEVVVFTSSFGGAEPFDRTFPHRVIRWPGSMLLPTRRVTRAVLNLVRDERPDILLFGAALPLAHIGVRLRERIGIPYATFTHGMENAGSHFLLGRRFLRRVGSTAALVTAVSGFVEERLQPFIKAPTLLERLPNGVDTEVFHPGISGERVRARWGLDPGPVITCVSRLVARKGQDTVIRALPRLVEEWPTIRFLIVGAGPSGWRLRRLAARYGVARQVVFTGEVPYAELPEYFQSGDVFVMPCRSRFGGLETEAFGAVYLQAAAVGRPSIGGRIGGVPEAVREGVTGVVVDGRSVAAVSAAIGDLLRDPVRARTLGQAGAQWVRQEMSWDAIASAARRMLLECVALRG